MKQWKGRTNEPLFWGLFGGGGMLAVFTMPVLIIGFGFLVPFGVFGGAEGSYERMSGLLTNPMGALAVMIGLGLILWHCCHRAFHGLHDLKIHPPELIRVAIYGVAVLVPTIGYALCLAS